MKYKSAPTPMGNVGVSYENQEAADAQAAAMDVGNNRGCFGCSCCSDCSCCSGCSGCFGCFGCSDCSGCSGCFGCSYCSDCSNCARCSYCSGCSDCSSIIRWRGGKAEKLLAINGLRWPVTTDGKKIQIGCECHTVDEWEGFDDARINQMSGKDALRFWQEFKLTVLAMARYRATKEKP